MSLAIQMGKAGGLRAMHQGDPGIFGSIFRGIKGAVTGLLGGGPLGAVTGALEGLRGRPTVGQAVSVGRTPPISRTAFAMPTSAGPGQRGLSSCTGLRTPGGGCVGFAPSEVGAFGPSMGSTTFGFTPGPGKALMLRPKAGHLNKTGYHLKDGTYVPPGSKVVPNRRLNPLNPTSLSRSLRRMQGFARATRHMRSEAGKIASAVQGPKRTSCPSCRKKKC